ncbi:hypothetical protein ACJMK2_029946 [Sinanodonta woodiana]|uniref:TIP41-like protein n=1 Tax=Sinanodonta woodiana TaxID=1069815 RepID=A0ABD3XDB6_SINWO
MTSVNRLHPGMPPRSKPEVEQYQFGPWKLLSRKSHILQSEGEDRERFEAELEIPQIPDMVFANNVLRLEHEDGFGIEFKAQDALKLVDAHHDPLKVAVSSVWKEARAGCEHINDVVKPFDWTYTTEYKGTLFGKDGVEFKVLPTEERIDMEKLKLREKIHFYEDMTLFEDELADNGTSILNVRMRVMPTSFFLLLRFYMRVDDVIARIIDTRVYHEAGTNYILREFTIKDDKTADIKAPPHVLTDHNELGRYLTLRKQSFEKLEFPPISCNTHIGDTSQSENDCDAMNIAVR